MTSATLFFATESERDSWLSTVNGQIKELKRMANRLENPQQYDHVMGL